MLIAGCLSSDRAEEAVTAAIEAGAKIERIGARSDTAAEIERPQPVDRDRLAARILELLDEFAVLVIDIDPAVAEIADHYVAGELTEARRRQRHAPRGIERAARGKAPQEMSVGVEDIDEAVA